MSDNEFVTLHFIHTSLNGLNKKNNDNNLLEWPSLDVDPQKLSNVTELFYSGYLYLMLWFVSVHLWPKKKETRQDENTFSTKLWKVFMTRRMQKILGFSVMFFFHDFMGEDCFLQLDIYESVSSYIILVSSPLSNMYHFELPKTVVHHFPVRFPTAGW